MLSSADAWKMRIKNVLLRQHLHVAVMCNAGLTKNLENVIKAQMPSTDAELLQFFMMKDS